MRKAVLGLVMVVCGVSAQSALGSVPGMRVPTSAPVALSPGGGSLAEAHRDARRHSVWSSSPAGSSDLPFAISRLRSYADGTVTFAVQVPGAGDVDVLETAWTDNLARVATLLQPSPGRFVFARAQARAASAATLRISVAPSARGRLLLSHHAYPVTLRLWVTYSAINGDSRSVGIYGLHVPACADPNHDRGCGPGVAARTHLPLIGNSTAATLVKTSGAALRTTFSASGRLLRLGGVTATGNELLTPLSGPPTIRYSLVGTETLATASGDELFGTVNGTGVNNAGATSGASVVTITGGTGRFIDATGSYTETYTGAITSQVGTVLRGSVSVKIHGRIRY